MTEKFYKLSYSDRLTKLVEWTQLTEQQAQTFVAQRNQETEPMVENYLTDFAVPVGVVERIFVNHQAYVVPIATEEPSVVAAANHGAKLLGDFEVTTSQPMLRRAQLFVTDEAVIDYVQAHQPELIAALNETQPRLVARGGGVVAIQTRQLEANLVSVDLLVNTQAAMGANIVNTLIETLSQLLKTAGQPVMAGIVSNLNTESLVTVKAMNQTLPQATKEKIVALSQLGQIDPYRAATENKGILNGAAGVVLATGNDWRAFEAGAHAYASLQENYQSLSRWTLDGDMLVGELTLPVAIGTVGGTINQHSTAQAMLALMDHPTTPVLASIIASVGLAQNLAALNALVTEGIQAGHMKMQSRLIQQSNEGASHDH